MIGCMPYLIIKEMLIKIPTRFYYILTKLAKV